MTDTATSTTTDTIRRYLEFWNSAPGDARRELAERVFARHVAYRAPIGERDGVDALVDLATEFTEQLGSLTITRRAEPEAHHGWARLAWALFRDGEPFAEGTDILVFDADGRIATVATFVDTAPEGFDPHAA